VGSFRRVPDPLELSGMGQVDRSNEEDGRSHLDMRRKHVSDEAIASTASREVNRAAAATTNDGSASCVSHSNGCLATGASQIDTCQRT